MKWRGGYLVRGPLRAGAGDHAASFSQIAGGFPLFGTKTTEPGSVPGSLPLGALSRVTAGSSLTFISSTTELVALHTTSAPQPR